MSTALAGRQRKLRLRMPRGRHYRTRAQPAGCGGRAAPVAGDNDAAAAMVERRSKGRSEAPRRVSVGRNIVIEIWAIALLVFVAFQLLLASRDVLADTVVSNI